ncbi:MAG: outer membrane protein [Gammaproteobacteria bacterium]|nr:outer membrane protein [Gammaproteobacteria bacterium]
MRYFLTLLSCLSLLFAGVSYAAIESESTVPTGVYIEGTVGYSHIAGAGLPIDTPSRVSISNGGLGYSADLGYQFGQLFGLEVGAASFAPQKATAAGQTFTADRSYIYDLAGKFTFPIKDKFDIFAKAGPAFMTRGASTDSEELGNYNEYGLGVAYGVGADYNFTQHVALTAQATGATPLIHLSSDFSNPNMPSMFLVSTGLKFTL